MSRLDDLRDTLEATIGLSPAKAQRLAKGLLDPATARDHMEKAASDVLEWSQRNRERLAELIRGEITKQLRSAGLATRAEVDTLTKRVRALERAAGTPAGKEPAAKASVAKPTAKKPAAKARAATKRAV